MKLRGIEYGKVFCAPGARGFFGEGYPFHHIWKLFGMDWTGTTPAFKTTTFLPREGQMPLKNDGITPKELMPHCIYVEPRSGHIVNAVSLSGPGAAVLFEDGRWQQRIDPFMLSFMSVAATKSERLNELRAYVRLAARYLPCFRASVALQVNYACPNTGLHIEELGQEVIESLDIASGLNVALVPNFNPLVPVEVLVSAANHPSCDALWIANSIPWGNPHINWVKLFGTTESPLKQRGLPLAGGLSGPACLPFTIAKVLQARAAGIRKPIVAGNGIQAIADAQHVLNAGADAIALGIVGIVRPWRLQGIIRAVNSMQ